MFDTNNDLNSEGHQVEPAVEADEEFFNSPEPRSTRLKWLNIVIVGFCGMILGFSIYFGWNILKNVRDVASATEVPVVLQPLPQGIVIEKMSSCGAAGTVGTWQEDKAPFTGTELVCGDDLFWNVTRLFYNDVEYIVPELENFVAPTPEPVVEEPAAPAAPVVPEVAAKNVDSTEEESIQTVVTNEDWTMVWYPAADLDRGDGTTFRLDAQDMVWKKLQPELWPTFPNEPNPLVPEFRVVNTTEVPDGLEYAMSETNFCQQIAGENCSVPVAAEHFLLYTGDYDIPGIGKCIGEEKNGCALAIVNVGRVTADLLGSFDQGFRIHARYWNGNALNMAMWGLMSHTSNVMLDLNSKLNPESIQNAGANCSVPEGCDQVHNRIVFISGNEVLLELTTTVSK